MPSWRAKATKHKAGLAIEAYGKDPTFRMVGEDFLKGEQDCLDNRGAVQRKRIPGRGHYADESTKDVKETGVFGRQRQ